MWKVVRIKVDLYDKLAKEANAENRSVANMLEVIISNALKE